MKDGKGELLAGDFLKATDLMIVAYSWPTRYQDGQMLQFASILRLYHTLKSVVMRVSAVSCANVRLFAGTFLSFIGFCFHCFI
jgi:hypothetical protein